MCSRCNYKLFLFVLVSCLSACTGKVTNGHTPSTSVEGEFTIDAYESLVNTTLVTITGTKPNGFGVRVDQAEWVPKGSATVWGLDLNLNTGDKTYVFEFQSVSPADELGEVLLVTITLDSTPPNITYKSPAENAVDIPLNSLVELSFNEAIDCTNIDNSKLTVIASSAGQDTGGTVTCDSTLATIRFEASADFEPNTYYTITLKAGITDLIGNAISSDSVWNFTTSATIDDIPPSPPTISPTPPASTSNPSITVSGNKEAGASVIAGKTDDPIQMTVKVPKGASDSWSSSFDLDIGSNTFYLRSEDQTGNTSTSSTLFSVERQATDTTGPKVIAKTPDQNATGVALDATIEVTFDEPIDCSTLTSSSSVIISVNSSVLCLGTGGSLTPVNSLQELTKYTAAIYSDVTDLAGNPMDADVLWTFTTGDFTPPSDPTFTAPSSPTDLATVTVNGGREDSASVGYRRTLLPSTLVEDWSEIIGKISGTTWSHTFNLNVGDNLIELRSEDTADLLSNVVSFQITRQDNQSTVNPPVLSPVISPTSVENQVISGSKPADTSIWIDGVRVVPLDSKTNFDTLLYLTPGNQTYNFTAKDASGNESSSIPAQIDYVSNGTADAGQVQIQLSIRDLFSYIGTEFGWGKWQSNAPGGNINHFSVEIWAEGPISFTGTNPYTYEPCYFDDNTKQRKYTRFVATVFRTAGRGCIANNGKANCFGWWGEPDYFSPNWTASLIELGQWASLPTPVASQIPVDVDRRNSAGQTWLPNEDTVNGCNKHLWYNRGWCSPRMQQAPPAQPNVDATTEASVNMSFVGSGSLPNWSYSGTFNWDLIDTTGAPVEKGAYLITAVITVDRDPGKARLQDQETCWDKATHDTIGSRRVEGIVMVDGNTPDTQSWSEKGFSEVVQACYGRPIDPTADYIDYIKCNCDAGDEYPCPATPNSQVGQPVTYLNGPAIIKYCPTGPVTANCP